MKQLNIQKKPIIDYLKQKISEGFVIPVTFTFDHGIYDNNQATRLAVIQAKLDELFRLINAHYFANQPNSLRAQYLKSKQGKKSGVEFAFVGFIEHLKYNYHVHGMIRPGIHTVVDDELLAYIKEQWKKLVPTGDAYFKPQEYKIPIGDKHATIKTGISLITTGDISETKYTYYITKEVRVIDGNMAGEFIYTGGL